MTSDRLFTDPDLAQFYDVDNGWSADCDYCCRLAEDARSVLDLGCGTGLLAAALAADRFVVGVDPAAAMLDIARRRLGGDRVSWFEADARDVRLDRQFDLVLLTGHAFQVFLSRGDQAAVLRTIAAHLGPGGRFVFDTRNPVAEAWLRWSPERSRRTIEHPRLDTIDAWNDAVHDPASGIVDYETHYRVNGSQRLFAAKSKIKFVSRHELADLLEDAGLMAEAWLGNWLGERFTLTLPEIIPVGRRRSSANGTRPSKAGRQLRCGQ